LLDWPLTLLIDEQKNALSPLADALTFLLGGTGSIALIAAFAPAIVAWTLDAELYKSTQAQSAVQSPATQAGGSAAAGVPGSDLVFAPMPMIASVLVILAPVLTSPFVDGLRAILPLVGGKPG
jgi:hypothetical protein